MISCRSFDLPRRSTPSCGVVVAFTRRRLAALVGVLVILGSPIATCAAGAAAQAVDPMAACHEAGRTAPEKAIDCCAQPDSQPQQLAASAVELVRAGSLAFLPALHPELRSSQEIEACLASPLAPSPDTGPPDCLAFSVLLI